MKIVIKKYWTLILSTIILLLTCLVYYTKTNSLAAEIEELKYVNQRLSGSLLTIYDKLELIDKDILFLDENIDNLFKNDSILFKWNYINY